LPQVVALGVVAGPALVGPGVLEREARDAEHADAVGAVRRVDGHPALAGSVPQQLEGVGSVDLGVPPLDVRHGVADHVAVQLEGVPRELGLGHRRLHEPGWRGGEKRVEGEKKANVKSSTGGKRKRFKVSSPFRVRLKLRCRSHK